LTAAEEVVGSESALAGEALGEMAYAEEKDSSRPVQTVEGTEAEVDSW
jgi:hypothetical protein